MKKISGGFYIKSRGVKVSWIAHAAPVVRETWDYLLREASYLDRKYHGYEIKRGQLFINYKQVREDLHWMVGYRKQLYSENQMKHCMKLLTNNGMIKLANQPRGVVITICNYDHYQNIKNYESTSESTINQPANQPSINQSSPSIIKEGKEINEKKKIIYSDEFEKAWKIYPRKISKKDAHLKWCATIKKGYSYDELIKCVINYQAYCIDLEYSEKFIKHMASFFGPKEHWKDFLIKKTVSKLQKKGPLDDFM